MTYHRHLRSSVADRLPTPAQLSEGQIALNFNATDPFLTIKDSAGVIRRITGASKVSLAPDVNDSTVQTMTAANQKGLLVRDNSIADGVAAAYKLTNTLDLGTFS